MNVTMVKIRSVEQMVIEEPRKQVTTTLSPEVYSKLQDISKNVYRGIAVSHALRCCIEDIWEQWHAKQNGKASNENS